MTPEVSVIIPVYNAERHLRECLDSVINQNYAEYKVLIIDDGSTDNSLEIAEEYSGKYDFIKVYSQINQGPSAARNTGIQHVTTPYITFLDADDKLKENYLISLMQPVISDSSVELVCGGYYEQNKHKPEGIALHDFSSFKGISYINKEQFLDNIFNGVTGVLWSKLFKTSIIKKYDLRLPEELKLSEDLIFVLRYARHINIVALVFEYIYYYNRLDDIGLSKSIDESYFKNLKLFNKLVLDEYNHKEEIESIIDERTGKILLKTLKNQNFSKPNLRKYYLLIIDNFGSSIFDFPKSNSNEIFISLLENKLYSLAYLQQKLIDFIKNLKNSFNSLI